MTTKQKLKTIFRAYPNQQLEKEYLINTLQVSERQVRHLISELAFEEPIIALSCDNGYSLANDDTSLDILEHQIADLNSRIKILKQRKRPLMKLWKKVKNIKGE